MGMKKAARRMDRARAARVAKPAEALRGTLRDIARVHGESAAAYCVASAAIDLLVDMGHEREDATQAVRDLFQPIPAPGESPPEVDGAEYAFCAVDEAAV